MVISILLALYVYERNFALNYSERLESIGVVRRDRRSILMIRVKVNLKSELIADRERNSALYVVVGYSTPSEGWGHGGRPWSPTSQATPQGLDQRS